MKINAIDEYGLRILIRLAKAADGDGLTINQLSETEGLSTAYVAKITRILKAGGLIKSTRGYKGGYELNMPPDQITIRAALAILGGTLYDNSFCSGHSGELKFCTNSVDCSLRSLWTVVQNSVDQILEQVTLVDLLGNEQSMENQLSFAFKDILPQVN